MLRDWVSQLRKGLMEFCLLNLLSNGESYGYEIVQTLKKIERLAVSESTVYPILTRLKEAGYLKVRVLPSSGGPPRRYFSLTASGESYSKRINEYWDDLNRAIQDLRGTPHTEETK